MDGFITLVLINHLVSCAPVTSLMSLKLTVGICSLTAKSLVSIAEGSLLVPVIQHQYIGSESLSTRLHGLILSSRDGLDEFVNCFSLRCLLCAILVDDVKALRRNR